MYDDLDHHKIISNAEMDGWVDIVGSCPFVFHAGSE